MPRARWLPTIASLASAASIGCGGPPDPVSVAKDAESWAASSALIGNQWRLGNVPHAYTHRALDGAGSELQKVAESAAQIPDTARDRSWIITRVRSVREGVAALDSAVARDDRGATPRAIGALATERHRLDSAVKAAEGNE